MDDRHQNLPRTAWVEVDLDRLQHNLALVRQFTPARVRLMAVVKAEAYGHGSVAVARVALANGASRLAVATLGEAAALRDAGLTAPILLLANPTPEELPYCREFDLTVTLSEIATGRELARYARQTGWVPRVHVKVNTGLNRYGFRWSEVDRWMPRVWALRQVRVEGVFSHFAMSDELDKSFAQEQQRRFRFVLQRLRAAHLRPGLRHLCNSGGLLDLPTAHLDLVRIGLVLLGVYPSKVCRLLPGLEPTLSLKARVVALQTVAAGETVGYGMRYQATRRRRIAVLPIGYADGFPRVRNAGRVLVRGQFAPIVGGVSMDAMMVDVTEIPHVQRWDEAVLVGEQGNNRIGVRELAELQGSVVYNVLAGLSERLPRRYLQGRAMNQPDAESGGPSDRRSQSRLDRSPSQLSRLHPTDRSGNGSGDDISHPNVL